MRVTQDRAWDLGGEEPTAGLEMWQTAGVKHYNCRNQYWACERNWGSRLWGQLTERAVRETIEVILT